MSTKYDDDIIVQKNKRNFFNSINIKESQLYGLDILYSDIIIDLKENSPTKTLKCDAVITQLKDIYVYLAFGDCIPFVVHDQEKSIFAFAHLGWQSICKDLHTKVVKSIIMQYNSNPSNLKIFFGPSITKESYAFENPAQLQIPEWKNHISYKNKLYHIDLVGYIIEHLCSLGIDEKNINKSNVNTATDLNYFSHYRSTRTKEKEGRFIYGAGMI